MKFILNNFPDDINFEPDEKLLAPFLIITLLGFTFLFVFGHNALVEHIIVFNALGAGADCLGVFLILRQIPKHAIVRNKKIKTYWKLPYTEVQNN